MRQIFHNHPFVGRLLFAVLLIAAATFAHGQTNNIVRWDLGAPGGSGVTTISGQGLPFIVAEPGVQLNWCNYPANTVPCTNYATTFSSYTGSACGNTTQVVLQNSSTCQATGDNFGNMGVYALGGRYDYTLTTNGVSYGPFHVDLDGTGTILPNPTQIGQCLVSTGLFFYDIGWSNSCGGGGGGLPTGVANGSALVSNGVSQDPIYQLKPQINVQDYGVAGNGVTDDTTAMQNAINAACSYNQPGATLVIPNNFSLKVTSSLTVAHCAGIIMDGGASQGQAAFSGGSGSDCNTPNKCATFMWFGPAGIPVIIINQTRDSIFKNFTVFANTSSNLVNGANSCLLIDAIAPRTGIITNNYYEDIQCFNGSANSGFIGIDICPTATGNCESQNFERVNVNCSFYAPTSFTSNGVGLGWEGTAGAEPYYERTHWLQISGCSRGIEIQGGTGTNVYDIDGGLQEGNWTDLFINAGRNISYRHTRSEFAVQPIVLGTVASSAAHDLTVQENSFSGLTTGITEICYAYATTGGILRIIKNDWDNNNTVIPFGPCPGSAGAIFDGEYDSQDNNYPNNTQCFTASLGHATSYTSSNDGPVNGSCSYGAFRIGGMAHGFLEVDDTPFVNLPTCSAIWKNTLKPVSDSTTSTLGATITGGGSNEVWADCNGTNWIVAINNALNSWNALASATGNALYANQNFSTTFTQASPVPWTWSNTTPAVVSGTAPPQPVAFNAISVGSGGCSSTSCALPLSIGSGSSVLIFTSDQAGSRSAPTDDGSNTYTLLSSTQLASWTSAVWYCLSCSAATTVTYSGTTAINGMSGGSFTGVSAIGANHYSSQSAGNIVSDTVTTTGTNSLIVANANMDTGTVFIPINGALRSFASNSASMSSAILTTPTYTSAGVPYTSSGNWITTSLYWQMRSVELLGVSGSVVNQSSPIQYLCGQFLISGGVSAPDCWSEQVQLGAGANPPSTLNFAHLLATTGAAVAQYPALRTPPNLFSTLPSCAAAIEGWMRAVADSTTNTWGATITGGGSDHVKAYCDGTNWTVDAK